MLSRWGWGLRGGGWGWRPLEPGGNVDRGGGGRAGVPRRRPHPDPRKVGEGHLVGRIKGSRVGGAGVLVQTLLPRGSAPPPPHP